MTTTSVDAAYKLIADIALLSAELEQLTSFRPSLSEMEEKLLRGALLSTGNPRSRFLYRVYEVGRVAQSLASRPPRTLPELDAMCRLRSVMTEVDSGIEFVALSYNPELVRRWLQCSKALSKLVWGSMQRAHPAGTLFCRKGINEAEPHEWLERRTEWMGLAGLVIEVLTEVRSLIASSGRDDPPHLIHMFLKVTDPMNHGPTVTQFRQLWASRGNHREGFIALLEEVRQDVKRFKELLCFQPTVPAQYMPAVLKELAWARVSGSPSFRGRAESLRTIAQMLPLYLETDAFHRPKDQTAALFAAFFADTPQPEPE